jgi:trimeric autotransporter adhesin
MNIRLRSLIGLSLVVFAVVAARAQVGSVTGWGDTSFGQLNFPPGLTNIVAVAAGLLHSAALRDDGTVVMWGDDSAFQRSSQPAGLAGVRAIAAGDNHTLALRSNGTVVAWGYDFPQTNVPAGLTSVRAIAAGSTFSMALGSNGTVVAWGTGAAATVPGGLINVGAIAAGANHALAVRNNGTVVGWGENAWGEATIPGTLDNVRFIAAGLDHTIAVRTNGTFFVAGRNQFGQISVPPSASNVVAMFAGYNHSGAVRSDGRVISWGDNTLGQINSLGLSNVITAVSHADHSLAIFLQRPSITTQPFSQTIGVGQLVTFSVVVSGSPPLGYQWRKDGTNISTANNPAFSITSVQPTNAGGYSVVVTNPIGSVTSLVATLTVSSAPNITTNPVSQTVGLNTNVTFTVAATGTAPLKFQWKKDGTNILNATNTTYQIPNTQPQHAGTYSAVVTNLYGAVESSNAVLTIVLPPTVQMDPQSQTVLAGSSVTLTVLSTNATTVQWQHSDTNLPGATSAMFTINRAQLSDAGTYVALLGNGFATIASQPATLTVLTSSVPSEVVLWGQDSVLVGEQFIEMAPPLGLVGVKAVAEGENYNLALRTDGSVVGWGDNQYGQAGLPPGIVATSIVAGANHTLAITNERVGAWGLNANGQATPPDITNVMAIAAAGNLSMALRGDGAVFVWGQASAGQSVLPPTVTNVASIAAGLEHCLALRRNGTVVGWAGNTFGQARAPFAVTNVNAGVAAIAAGAFHSLALKSNGTVIAWGRNNFDQTNVPPQATNIIAIAAGADHSLALRNDGTVIGWGNNNYGQIETPNGLAAFGIAAGAARSLAVRQTGLKLLPPVLVSPTQILFELRNLNGSLMPETRATNIEVFATTNVTLTSTNWVKVNNVIFVSSNRAAIFTDNPAQQPQRFFRVREQ